MANEPVPVDRSFLTVPDIAGGAARALFPNIDTGGGGSIFWTPPLQSKSQEVRQSRGEIVKQARQAERASEPIRGGLDRQADMVVGSALRVHPQPDWETLGITDENQRKELVAAMRREFNNWAYDSRLLCDAEGHYNFAGLMWMGFRNLSGPDAECAIVIHYDEDREAALKARWATYVTVVDPDRIETPSQEAANPDVFMGRKLDKNGRFVGMYVRKKHPAEGWTGANEDYQFVPRETDFGRPMAIHWFIKTRGAQQRGLSPLVTVLKQVNMMRKFDESYLASAIINSQLATYIKTKSSARVAAENLAPAPSITEGAEWAFFNQKTGYYKEAKFRVGGSRLAVLPPDDEIVMTAVNRGIDDPAPFRNGFLREQASAVGNSFEQLALNYTETNYSGARAGELQVQRGVVRIRTMFTWHVATPIYGCVIEEAIAKGRIKLPAGAPPFQEFRTAYIACAWTGPGMLWIDPQKEANAYKTLIDLKVTSRQRIAAERGDDFFEILDELAAERDAAEEHDLSLDVLMPGQDDPNNQDQANETSASGVPKTKKKSRGGAPARDGDGDGQTNDKGNE